VLALLANGRVDAIVLPRLGWPPGNEQRMRSFLRTLRRAGNVLIYEADDDVFSPWISRQQKAGILAEKTVEELEAERSTRVEALRLCDGVTVSSQRLATVVRSLVPEHFPVEVVPNYLDWEWWQNIGKVAQRQLTASGPVIGWAGGGRPERDMMAMAQAWGDVAKVRDDVTFVVQGCRPDEQGAPSVLRTPWALPIAAQVPPERLRLLPWMDVRTYPLGYFELDIGCAPLAETAFNRCKTPIKAMEYAAAGAAVVASPTVYGNLIMHGVTGFLCERREEWTQALLYLLEHEDERRTMAKKLGYVVRQEYNLQRQYWRWPVAWARIVQAAKRPRLILAGRE
jgi:glycosyltransferase involved in cell wall biosynthesis